jgi:AcrR family transcriptional regulator
LEKNLMTSSVGSSALRYHILIVMNRMVETTVLEDIAVSDLCRAAKVSRSTFYRLFEDKYDVVNWASMLSFKAGVVETGRTLTWAGGLLVTMSGGILLEPLWKEAVKTTGYNSPPVFAARTRRESMAETISKYKHHKLTPQLQFQIDAFAEMESLVITKWISDRNRMPLPQFCQMVESCVPRRLYELVGEPNEPREARELTFAEMLLLATA